MAAGVCEFEVKLPVKKEFEVNLSELYVKIKSCRPCK
jgi:hypothetical protein